MKLIILGTREIQPRSYKVAERTSRTSITSGRRERQ